MHPDLKVSPFETISPLRPASSTSIAALEPAPPEPIIKTSVEIVLVSIVITCKIYTVFKFITDC